MIKPNPQDSSQPPSSTPAWDEGTIRLPPGYDLPRIPGYEVISLIGKGGMGRVYQARHLQLDRIVALKVMSGGRFGEAAAQFLEEARVIARLRHPNIVQVFDVGMAGDLLFYAMEHMPGGSLSNALRGEPLDPLAACRMIETLARAVQHAHDQGIVHRDLKPANVLLMIDEGRRFRVEPDAGFDTSFRKNPENFQPKIADFGMARRLKSPGQTRSSGLILGTPSYMAPEQAAGQNDVGPLADVYALGAILYECLCGRPPFRGTDPIQTVYMVQAQDPVSPRQLAQHIPRDLETICLKCLEKSPRNRYSSARALADDLARFYSHQPIQARPVRPWVRLGKWAARHRAGAVAVAAGAAGIVCLGVAVILLQSAYRSARNENQRLAEEVKNNEANWSAAHALISGWLRESSEEIPAPVLDAARLKRLESAREFLALQAASSLTPIASSLRAQIMLAEVDRRLQRLDSAADLARQAMEGYKALEATHPGGPENHLLRLEALTTIAAIMRDRRDRDAVNAAVAEAMPEVERLLQESPEHREVLRLAGRLKSVQASADQDAKDYDAAADHFRESLRFHDLRVKLTPNETTPALDLGRTWYGLSSDQVMQNRFAEAINSLAMAETTLPRSEAPSVRECRVLIYHVRGLAYDKLGKKAEAHKQYQSAESTAAALAQDFQAAPEYRLLQVRAKLSHVQSLEIPGDAEKARKLIREAGVLLDRLTTEIPENPRLAILRSMHADLSKEFGKSP